MLLVDFGRLCVYIQRKLERTKLEIIIAVRRFFVIMLCVNAGPEKKFYV